VLNLVSNNLPLNIAIIIAGSLVVVLVGALVGLLYRGIDRKLSAHMQGRIGPPIVQPFR